MAHKKAGGTTTNGRDSRAKRRGVKRFGGQLVLAGEVLVRQKGTLFRAGKNAYMGKDWTIHAEKDGMVHFSRKSLPTFSGSRQNVTLVHIIDAPAKA